MTRRRTAVVVAIAVLLAATACSGSSPHATAPPRPSEPTTLLPAGPTALPVGLVTPPDTRLVSLESASLPDLGWYAVLTVESHPSAVWRNLVAQLAKLEVRLLSQPVRACAWSATPPITPRPATTSTLPSATGPVLSCNLEVDVPQSGEFVDVDVAEIWGQGQAQLLVTGVGPGPAQHAVPGSIAAADGATDPVPTPPSGVDPVLPGVGRPFGAINDCVESGYGFLRVPAGAALVAPAGGPIDNFDFVAVLRVDDPRLVVDELQAQIAAGDPRAKRVATRERASDGTTVWVAPGNASAGGGFCTIVSSTDGHHVFVATHSD